MNNIFIGLTFGLLTNIVLAAEGDWGITKG